MTAGDLPSCIVRRDALHAAAQLVPPQTEARVESILRADRGDMIELVVGEGPLEVSYDDIAHVVNALRVLAGADLPETARATEGMRLELGTFAGAIASAILAVAWLPVVDAGSMPLWPAMVAAALGCVLIALSFLLGHLRHQREKCGALAPVEANLGMTVCALKPGHDGDHQDRHRYRWPRGPFRRTET